MRTRCLKPAPRLKIVSPPARFPAGYREGGRTGNSHVLHHPRRSRDPFQQFQQHPVRRGAFRRGRAVRHRDGEIGRRRGVVQRRHLSTAPKGLPRVAGQIPGRDEKDKQISEKTEATLQQI